jgi:hypothetical protein
MLMARNRRMREQWCFNQRFNFSNTSHRSSQDKAKKARNLVISIEASRTGEALALGGMISYDSRPYSGKPGTPQQG